MGVVWGMCGGFENLTRVRPLGLETGVPRPLSVTLEQRWLGLWWVCSGTRLHIVTKETKQGESVTGK